MSEEINDLTQTKEATQLATKFKGDIIFNDGEKDVKVSELLSKSQLPTIDTLLDAFTSGPTPISPIILKDDFEFEDSHVMSTLAVRMLIGTTFLMGDSAYIKRDMVVTNINEKLYEIEELQDMDNHWRIEFAGVMTPTELDVMNPPDMKGKYIFEHSQGFSNEYRNSERNTLLELKTYSDTYPIQIKSLSDPTICYNKESDNIKILYYPYKLKDRYVPSISYVESLLSKIEVPSNTTITHYCPIEAGEDINMYEIGKPVFLSGHVYKYENNKFISSTATDSTDCICSVVINGTWKEYVGIVTSIDAKNKCITFSSHGDYLFYVDDSNIYQVGDVVLYDGRIIDEDYAITLKIQQSIAGKITAKINEHIVALFKA